MWQKIHVPDGDRIIVSGHTLTVSNNPIVPFIEGDGIGPDIWRAAQLVFDEAVKKAYGGKRKISWMEVYAGEKACEVYGKDEWLPQETLEALDIYKVAIKGPLTTPVGGGIRSLNVALRQNLDLYACVRPVRYFNGVPTPLKHPERLNVVIFRENTEDVYAGIEWEEGTAECQKVIAFLNRDMGKTIREDSGIGIKPISMFGSKRLIRKALQYALSHGRRSVTLVHKGNIMKFTEGAFKNWGYDLTADEFKDGVISEDTLWKSYDGRLPDDKVVIKDRIADAMFQQVLLRPDEYEVIATPNLNGDYLSDACAACVGGLGLAPGANMGDTIALFEATHGTAPKYAGLDKVNPGSVILSGVMMFEHIGWGEVARLIDKGLTGAINAKTVTYDLARQMDGAKKVKCSEFGQCIVDNF